MRRSRGDSLRTRFRENGGLLRSIAASHSGPGHAAHTSKLKNTATGTTKSWLPVMKNVKQIPSQCFSAPARGRISECGMKLTFLVQRRLLSSQWSWHHCL